MNVAIIGYGKMGKEVEKILSERAVSYTHLTLPTTD